MLRRYSHQVKMRLLPPKPMPALMSEPYIRQALPAGFAVMGDFFNLEQVRLPQQYARICSLEYLCQRLNAAVAS